MARGPELTIAGKRYANAAPYIQTMLGSLRSLVASRGSPIEVTVRPDGRLDEDEVRALL